MQYDDGQRNGWLRTHNIGTLQDAARTFPDGQRILAGNDFSFVMEYAIEAPYEGVQQSLPDEEGVLSAIKATVTAMMEFIENDAGASLPRYTPPGLKGIANDQAEL